ncbi:hypothetical protein M6B38_250985 [Iris pallida]|uniref:Uncharacterized protein n=1 Tax=Iris pallida TaxID=29817 RepID=A0AAX6IIJ9_IRIPA|nr:hypothetical protein M6B38_250985 [Iris pallida]
MELCGVHRKPGVDGPRRVDIFRFGGGRGDCPSAFPVLADLCRFALRSVLHIVQHHSLSSDLADENGGLWYCCEGKIRLQVVMEIILTGRPYIVN